MISYCLRSKRKGGTYLCADFRMYLQSLMLLSIFPLIDGKIQEYNGEHEGSRIEGSGDFGLRPAGYGDWSESDWASPNTFTDDEDFSHGKGGYYDYGSGWKPDLAQPSPDPDSEDFHRVYGQRTFSTDGSGDDLSSFPGSEDWGSGNIIDDDLVPQPEVDAGSSFSSSSTEAAPSPRWTTSTTAHPPTQETTPATVFQPSLPSSTTEPPFEVDTSSSTTDRTQLPFEPKQATEPPVTAVWEPEEEIQSSGPDLGPKPTGGVVDPFLEPYILAAVIGGAVLGLVLAIILVIFIVYRMRKKDEGSYVLDEPKSPPTYPYAYHKAPPREFYA